MIVKYTDCTPFILRGKKDNNREGYQTSGIKLIYSSILSLISKLYTNKLGQALEIARWGKYR